MIDLIEGCNYKCYFCEARDVKQFKYLNLDLFKSIVLQAEELGLTEIHMVPLKGEPFLHPDIYEMIDFADAHVKNLYIKSNGSAINVPELSRTNRKNLRLGISYYGSTVEKFKELTCTNASQFKIFHRKLAELKEYNIEHQIDRRDVDWTFNYDGIETRPPFNGNKKCLQHQRPIILVDGKVTFCSFIPGIVRDHSAMNFSDLNTVSLEQALSNPLRYKFFDSQSICEKYCVDVDEHCHINPPIQMYKLMTMSKKQYEQDKESVDLEYNKFEKIVDLIHKK